VKIPLKVNISYSVTTSHGRNILEIKRKVFRQGVETKIFVSNNIIGEEVTIAMCIELQR
jgi:hypothetical protein